MRTLVCLCLVLSLCVVAMAEQTFSVAITKIDGDKITVKTAKFDAETKKTEYGEPVTLKVGDKVSVVKGTFNKETKKLEAGDAIEGGLKASLFKDITDKGVRATITTDGDKDKKAPEGTVTKIIASEPKVK